jgi:hypothetical protein
VHNVEGVKGDMIDAEDTLVATLLCVLISVVST